MYRLVAIAVALVALVAAYVVGDASDSIPGPLTTAPRVVATARAAPGAVVPAREALGPSTSAPYLMPEPDRLRQALAPLLDDPAIGPGAAMAVLDAQTGATLLDVNSSAAAPPASTAKVLTAVAALHALGPDARLPTKVVAGDTAQQIVLVGGGDIFLASGRGDPRRTVGAAGLVELAEHTVAELNARETRSVTLVLDDQLFPGVGTGQPLNPGWAEADVLAGYVAPATPLAINAGRVDDSRYAQRQPDPAMTVAEVFAERLRDRGIQVAPIIQRARAPRSATPLALVWSAPIRDLVALTLRESDNNGADVLGRLVAMRRGGAADGPAAGQAVLAEVASLGVPTSGLRLAGASGLSAGSRLSVRALAEAIRISTDDQHPKLASLGSSLPVAGLTGTLADRFAAKGGSAAAGRARAKSGSLATVSSVAGFVRDRDGRVLIYAVIAPAVANGWGARDAIDTMIATLATCGCR